VKRHIGLVIALATFLPPTGHALELKDPFETPLGRQYRRELDVLTPPPGRLPPTCRLVREAGTAPIFPATTNPFVTDDPQLIEFISLVGFGSERLHDVSVAISAVFYEAEPRHEIGVWALQFRSTKAALEARSSLGAGDVLMRDRMMVSLWRDDEVGRACQRAIDAHLIQNGFVTWERKP
jgi:hypothetical protein